MKKVGILIFAALVFTGCTKKPSIEFQHLSSETYEPGEIIEFNIYQEECEVIQFDYGDGNSALIEPSNSLVTIPYVYNHETTVTIVATGTNDRGIDVASIEVKIEK